MNDNVKKIVLPLFYLLIIGSVIFMFYDLTSQKKEEINATTTQKEKYVNFEYTGYSCEAGKSIKIKANGDFEGIKFYSSNNSYATVYESDEACENCKYINVDCLKGGNVSIGYKYYDEEGKRVNLRITPSTTIVASDEKETEEDYEDDFDEEVITSKDSVVFDSKSYSCKKGKKINTKVTATSSTNSDVEISSFKSNSTSIATVSEDTSKGDCENCKYLVINCKGTGKTVITATSSTGASAKANVTVSKNSSSSGTSTKTEDKGKVVFTEDSYSCVASKSISTTITAVSDTNKKLKISSYSISDTSIATVSEDTSKGNCTNCKYIIINCIKSGKTSISATSSSGVTKTENINVSEVNVGKIVFDKTYYTCKTGKTITAVISVSPSDNNSVNSLKSSDKTIATIAKSSTTANCLGCEVAEIKCIKAGTVTFTATSKLGATATTKATISQADIGKVSFTESSYKCKAGTTITGKVSVSAVNSSVPLVTGYKSSNKNVAKIEKTSDKAFKINCISSGEVTLRVTTALGAVGEAKAKVYVPDTGSITFKKSNYYCYPGESFETTVTAKGILSSDGSAAKVDWVKSAYPSIAKVEKVSVKDNVKTVKISCVAAGTVKLTASSTTGVTSTSTLKVASTGGALGSIAYEKDSYSCYSGKSFETKVTAKGGSDAGSVAQVNSVSSSDTSVATVEKVSTDKNVSTVKVNCIKKGTVTLSAKSTYGATTSTKPKVTVTDYVGSVKFDKDSYVAAKNEKITVVVTPKGDKNTISSLTASSTNCKVSSLSNDSSCTGCKKATVYCSVAGDYTLTVKSSLGAKKTVKFTVKNSLGSISFDKTAYTCTEGNSFVATITPSAGNYKEKEVSVKSYPIINNSYIKTILNTANAAQKNSTSTCNNCVKLIVECNKATSSAQKLTAKSSLNASASATVTVKANKGKLSFDESTYTCKAGQEVMIKIKASITSDLGTLKVSIPKNKITIDNTTIAKIDTDSFTGSTTERTFKVKCVKSGTATITAKSVINDKTVSLTKTATINVN